jgi:sugar phosphate isomerase/epimerase
VQDHSDIGISTGAYAGLPLAEALQRIAELAPSVEICSFGRHSLLKPENIRAITANSLPFSVHGPFLHIEIGSRSSLHAATEVHRRHMEVAAEYGAHLYVVHPDLQPRPRPWSRKIAAHLERSFAELRVLQDELGLCVAVENLHLANRSHFTAPGDVDLQGLSLALDVGHAALTGTLGDWLADTITTLRHLHLHDNQGHRGGDQHHPLGTGIIDVAPALAAARAADATIILEHVNEADVLTSLEYLRARGLLARPIA